MFLELLSAAGSTGESRLSDRPVAMWLRPATGDTVIRSDLGRLTIEGRRVVVGRPGEAPEREEAV